MIIQGDHVLFVFWGWKSDNLDSFFFSFNLVQQFAKIFENVATFFSERRNSISRAGFSYEFIGHDIHTHYSSIVSQHTYDGIRDQFSSATTGKKKERTVWSVENAQAPTNACKRLTRLCQENHWTDGKQPLRGLNGSWELGISLIQLWPNIPRWQHPKKRSSCQYIIRV